MDSIDSILYDHSKIAFALINPLRFNMHFAFESLGLFSEAKDILNCTDGKFESLLMQESVLKCENIKELNNMYNASIKGNSLI